MEAPLKDCTTLEQRAVIRFLNAEAMSYWEQLLLFPYDDSEEDSIQKEEELALKLELFDNSAGFLSEKEHGTMLKDKLIQHPGVLALFKTCRFLAETLKDSYEQCISLKLKLIESEKNPNKPPVRHVGTAADKFELKKDAAIEVSDSALANSYKYLVEGYLGYVSTPQSSLLLELGVHRERESGVEHVLGILLVELGELRGWGTMSYWEQLLLFPYDESEEDSIQKEEELALKLELFDNSAGFLSDKEHGTLLKDKLIHHPGVLALFKTCRFLAESLKDSYEQSISLMLQLKESEKMPNKISLKDAAIEVSDSALAQPVSSIDERDLPCAPAAEKDSNELAIVPYGHHAIPRMHIRFQMLTANQDSAHQICQPSLMVPLSFVTIAFSILKAYVDKVEAKNRFLDIALEMAKHSMNEVVKEKRHMETEMACERAHFFSLLKQKEEEFEALSKGMKENVETFLENSALIGRLPGVCVHSTVLPPPGIGSHRERESGVEHVLGILLVELGELRGWGV
ncbi:hypothetical protein LAZ67_9003623 [Cordylochernes scorpioides]|uniref:Uncharacterized protein n=1 Tax=Cordylochernes scorpioides TaxID=51811 RepID=A0ABY6KUI3_9ARAC|nr:hypothetical protein LAZ67_9003623 [Cordylochernes scorpioides]